MRSQTIAADSIRLAVGSCRRKTALGTWVHQTLLIVHIWCARSLFSKYRSYANMAAANRVAFRLCFKASPSENKTNFHMKGFAPRTCFETCERQLGNRLLA